MSSLRCLRIGFAGSPMIHPSDHLRAAAKLYPNAWKQVDMMRADRGQVLPDWPDWCFLPIAGWYSIVSAATGQDRLSVELVGDVGRLAALGTWRVSQGIYRFSAEVRESLTASAISGPIPSDVLLRLPQWCVYIDTPGLGVEVDGSQLHGFFAHLEADANDGHQELRLLLATEDALVPLPLHIGDWTVAEALDRMVAESKRQAQVAGVVGDLVSPVGRQLEELADAVSPLVNLVLYLCSEEPEVVDPRHPGTQPGRPAAKKTKKGWRTFPPPAPTVWEVGQDIARQIREAREYGGGHHKGPRPHIRKAHWHSFRVGPGRKHVVLKWLAPIAVAMRDEDPPDEGDNV